jgi:hypothetical protein
MMDESKVMHSSDDLESAIAGENPMLVSFVPKKESNDFVEVKRYGICAKICLCVFVTALMSPLAICDLYFALTDTSCINQAFHNLQINMQGYLFISGIIGVSIIGIIDLLILAIDYNFDKKSNKGDTGVILTIAGWIFKLFSISWLVLGCTIFWSFMDTKKCSKPTYSYLLARFIIYIVGVAITVFKNEK